MITLTLGDKDSQAFNSRKLLNNVILSIEQNEEGEIKMIVVQLNTGINIPIVGTGTNTYGKVDGNYQGEINGDTTELESAIAQGYRHIDTAISYRNESVVGEAIKKSGVAREKFFITSKIPGRPEYTKDRAAVEAGIQASLDALQTDYIDLYLIHHPWESLEEMVSVWKVLEDYVDKGVLRAIGVSNFDEEELQFVLDNARIAPAVNQIKSNPSNWNHDLVKYSLAREVIPEAWGPLSGVDEEAKAMLTEIGQRYDKTWAQIILRYQIERGVIVIPKSHNQERQKLNLDIFDFELSSEDRQVISALAK